MSTRYSTRQASEQMGRRRRASDKTSLGYDAGWPKGYRRPAEV
jgi:hypothetical protein